MCVYLYIQNNYTHHTHIYYVKTQTFILDAINRFTALLNSVHFIVKFKQ